MPYYRGAGFRYVTPITKEESRFYAFNIPMRGEIPSDTVRDFLNGWLDGKRRELAEGSIPEYRKAVEHLLNGLGPKAGQPLDMTTLVPMTRMHTYRDRGQDRGQPKKSITYPCLQEHCPTKCGNGSSFTY